MDGGNKRGAVVVKEVNNEGSVKDVEVIVGERKLVVKLGLEEVEAASGVRWALRKQRRWACGWRE
jgi:hypothetical protein